MLRRSRAPSRSPCRRSSPYSFSRIANGDAPGWRLVHGGDSPWPSRVRRGACIAGRRMLAALKLPGPQSPLRPSAFRHVESTGVHVEIVDTPGGLLALEADYDSGFEPSWGEYGVMTTTVAEAISKTRWGARAVPLEHAVERRAGLRARLAWRVSAGDGRRGPAVGGNALRHAPQAALEARDARLTGA